MNISKSLKIKNRLAGQLKALEQRAQSNNSYKEGQQPSIDMNKTWMELTEVRQELVNLKGKIALATAKITPKLVALAELKSEITFYEDLNINEGTSRDYDGDKIVSVKMINIIDNATKIAAVNELQKKIDNLQDEIDEYNASTSV